YSPQQNGVVERRNQTIVGMAHSMMKAKAMPAEFWGEAVSTEVFILNRSPTKALKGMTPYQAWYGRKPNVSYLRTFGCIGHVKTVKPGLGKLEDRSTKMVFLGYEDGTKAYRLYDPAREKVVVSRDVVFDEAAAWSWSTPAAGEAEGSGGGLMGEFVVEQLVIERRSGAEEAAQEPESGGGGASKSWHDGGSAKSWRGEFSVPSLPCFSRTGDPD